MESQWTFRLLCVFYPPRDSRPQFIWGFVIILILILDLIIVTFYAPLVFDMSTRVRFLLDISQVYAPVISYAVIIIESALSRHRLALVWKNFQEVLEIFEQDLEITNIKSRFKKILLKCKIFGGIIQLICTGSEFIIIIGIRKNASWFKNRWSAFPGFLGCRTSILLYIFHVQIVTFLLQSLVLCQKRIHSNYNSRLMRFDRKQVENELHLRRIFNKIFLISGLLNESFKWSLLLNFITNVFCICVAWFWNYVALRFGNKYLFGE